jgi:hypothetical protein
LALTVDDGVCKIAGTTELYATQNRSSNQADFTPGFIVQAVSGRSKGARARVTWPFHLLTESRAGGAGMEQQGRLRIAGGKTRRPDSQLLAGRMAGAVGSITSPWFRHSAAILPTQKPGLSKMAQRGVHRYSGRRQ